MAINSRSRDELLADGAYGSATSSLLRMVGGWGNFSGPSLFMLRVLVSGSTTAVAFGITASTIAATIFGTASLPWMIGSCAGFVFGTIGVYRDSLTKALFAVDLFPKLMQLHLDANFPALGFRNWDRHRMKSIEFSRSWTMRSMLVVSFLTAQEALDDIFEARQRAVVDEISRGDDITKEADNVLEDGAKMLIESAAEAAV